MKLGIASNGRTIYFQLTPREIDTLFDGASLRHGKIAFEYDPKTDSAVLFRDEAGHQGWTTGDHNEQRFSVTGGSVHPGLEVLPRIHGKRHFPSKEVRKGDLPAIWFAIPRETQAPVNGAPSALLFHPQENPPSEVRHLEPPTTDKLKALMAKTSAEAHRVGATLFLRSDGTLGAKIITETEL